MLPSSRKLAAAAALWLSVQYWVLGPYSAVSIHDNADITLPHWLALAHSGAAAAARWMPWPMGGIDRLANDYPLDQPLLWLFFAFPGWLAWGLLLFLHSFLAALGMQRLCVDSLETSDEAGAAAGGMFAVALARGYVFKNAWGYALLPAALWLLDRLLRDRKTSPARAAALAALAGAVFGLCSSGPLTLPFALAAVPVWLWLRGAPGARGLFCAAGFVAAAAAVRYRVFAAMWAEAPLSHRLRVAAEHSGPLTQLASLAGDAATELWPAFALIAVGAWAARGRRARLARFLSVTATFLASPAFISLLIAAAGERLGRIKGFSFDRFAGLVPLWASMSAALAFDLLPSRRRRSALSLFTAALLLWSFAPKVSDVKDWYFQGSYAALFSGSAMKSLPSEDPYRVATVPHGLHPAYANAYGLESVDSYANLYSERYRQFWAEVVAPTLDKDAAFRRYLLQQGNRVYLYLREAPPSGSTLAFSEHWRLDLLSLAGVRFVFSRLELSDPLLQEVRRGARPETGSFRERLFRRLRRNFGGDDGLFVYENSAALPRAFVVPEAVRASSPDEAIFLLRAASAGAFRQRVVVENASGPLPSGRGFLIPKIVSYSADRLELDLNGVGPGMLVVTDTWSPRRAAEIDGRSVPIMPAWGVFVAVSLTGPARKIVLTYGR